MTDQNDPHHLFKKIQQIKGFDEKKLFDTSIEENVQIRIRVDESVSPGMFKKDPLVPGGFVANSLTIRAVRQDLFFLDESFEDLADKVECSCGQILDAQFWKLCPHCGRALF